MYQSQISNIIIRLKRAKNKEPQLTLQSISEQTGVSMSTVTRVFADDSENQSFRYDSLKPLSQLLLGTDGLDDEMDSDEVQMRISQIKEKYEKKIDNERAQFRRSLDHLNHQIDLKDKRIDTLMDALDKRAVQYEELLKRYFTLLDSTMESKEG